MEVRYWHHPAETINFLTENSEAISTIQIFTDGRMSEEGRVAGVAIFRSGKHKKSKVQVKKDAPTIKPNR